MKIGLDAGHGGKDPGAVGGNVWEKNITLNIARLAGEIADKHGHAVVMTRDDDTYMSLTRRFTKFNTAKVDVAISIHANASTRASSRGCWVIFKDGNTDGQALADAIGQSVQRQCPAICQPTYIDDGDPILHKVPRVLTAKAASGKRLSMIYGPRARGVVLIETAFITNADDRALLLKASVQKGIAKAIVDGAEAWAKPRGIK